MGYSFTLLDLPKEVDDLRKSADRILREARRDHRSYFRAMDSYFDAVEPFTFELNAAGIGLCRERMRALGMLAGGKHRPFPTYPNWDRAHYASEAEHRLTNPEVWATYDADELAASRQRGVGRGIAAFKLESNGPWIVVPEEVQQALRIFADLHPEQRAEVSEDPTFRSWIEWLRRATGGFEVT